MRTALVSPILVQCGRWATVLLHDLPGIAPSSGMLVG